MPLPSAPALPPEPRLRTRGWLGTFLAVATTLVGVNVYVSVILRDEVIAREQQQVQALASVAAASVESSFKVTRVAMESVRTAQRRGLSPAEMHALLRATADASPFLRAIGVVDTAGHIVYSSRGAVPPSVPLGQEEYVRHYAAGRDDAFLITGPTRNPVDGKWQVNLTLPIAEPDGPVTRLVVAVVDPFQVQAELLTLGQPGHDRLLLLERQLRVVASSPWDDALMTRSVADAPLMRELSRPGTADAAGVFDTLFADERRLAAGRWLLDRHFVLAISRPLEPTLAYWRTAAAVTAAGSVLALVLLALSWRVSAAFHRRQQVQARLLEQMNRELQHENARAEELARAKGDFLANMSHEIRTPLNGVIGYAALLLEDPTLQPQARGWARRINDASAALRGIIDEILEFSRLEAGSPTLDAEPFEIGSLVDNCVSLVRPAAAAKGLSLTHEVSGNALPWLLGDGARLRQAVLNFLNNAVKFTSSGGVHLAAHGQPLPDGRWQLRIEVSDTGIGIAPDKLPLLFQRFSQADSSTSRRFGGTGLGLAISRRLVEAMDGQVGVRSEAGAGSTFWIALVLPAAAGGPAHESAAASGPQDGGEPLDILVVDDHEMNRELVETLLTRAGHRVTLASDGEAAINRLRGQHFDLVLMDMQMPGIDGIEATRRIRAELPGARGTPIVAMTANVMADQVATYMSVGMAGHIGKPIDARDLVAGVRRWARPVADGLTSPLTASPAPQRTPDNAAAPDRAPERAPEGADDAASGAAQGTAHGTASGAVHDAAALDELLALLGRDGVLPFLQQLQATLADAAWSAQDTDAAALRRLSHTTINTAGQLGFRALSLACRGIEAALAEGGDGLAAARDAFRIARDQAAPVLHGLITRLREAEMTAGPPAG